MEYNHIYDVRLTVQYNMRFSDVTKILLSTNMYSVMYVL